MDAIARTTPTHDLGLLAITIGRRGLAGLQPGDLQRVARHGRAVGASAALVEALLDESAPEVVRCRAFGQIHRRVAAVAAAAAAAAEASGSLSGMRGVQLVA